MRAPRFWWSPRPTMMARVLAPAGWLYGGITARRMGRAGVQLPTPVLCVGNLVAGGAGKTPTAIALARLLYAQGHRPAFLSRGYGRTNSSATTILAVEPDVHGADEVGDEPLLLAQVAPTFVGRDRIEAGQAAIAAGATVLVLDDGLQNSQFRKQVALVVVDGGTGVGNGFCVPAGPLRAPLAAQWPHVSAVCIIGDGTPGERVAHDAQRRGVPVWTARLVPDPAVVERLRATPLLAFAGIGHPPKFFDTLRRCGLAVSATRAFPDHHRYRPAELDDLLRAAEQMSARLVTTEKDRMRLPASAPVDSLPVQLVFDDPPGIAAFLTSRFSSAGAA